MISTTMEPDMDSLAGAWQVGDKKMPRVALKFFDLNGVGRRVDTVGRRIDFSLKVVG